MLSLKEYYILLNAHDWYYAFSDDTRVYNAGVSSLRALKKLMDQSPEHAELFNAFQAHHFTGPGFGNPRQPKPDLKLYERESNEETQKECSEAQKA